MPKDEISNPRKAPVLAIDDADDEVIDLLEVVKPGRNLKANVGNDDGDFSADLDAMLDGLSEAGAQGDDAPDKPVPFPDPTPVNHKVDHNETLDLPGMDDLDHLLKSFGEPGAGAGKEEAVEPNFADIDLNLPDLDALPTPPASGKKAVAPAAPPAPTQAIPKTPSAESAPQRATEDELFASLLNATAAPAPEKSDKATKAPSEAEDDLFADLDLALGKDTANKGGATAQDADLLADLGLPPLRVDDAAPNAGGASDLGDLNLDDLIQEEETLPSVVKRPSAKDVQPKQAHSKSTTKEEIGRVLMDGGDLGLEDLNFDALGSEEEAPAPKGKTPTIPAMDDDLDLALAATGDLGLEDLNLDTLGLEDEAPKAEAKAAPVAPAKAQAKAPVVPAMDDDLDLALAATGDLGLEDLNLDSLGLEDKTPKAKAAPDSTTAVLESDGLDDPDLAALGISGSGSAEAELDLPDLDEAIASASAGAAGEVVDSADRDAIDVLPEPKTLAEPSLMESDGLDSEDLDVPLPEDNALVASVPADDADLDLALAEESDAPPFDALPPLDDDSEAVSVIPDEAPAETPEAAASIADEGISAGKGQSSRFDEVDLNELDALLDDMLATAPASGPSPAAAIAANGQAATAQAALKAAVPGKTAAPANDAVSPFQSDLAELQTRLAGQEAALAELQTQCAGQDSALNALQNQASAQDIALNEFRDQAGAHGADLDDLRAQLAERTASFTEQAEQARALHDQLASLSAETEEQKGRFAEYTDEVQELGQRLSDHSDRIQALEQAASTAGVSAPAETGDSLSECVAEVQELAQRFSDSSDKIQGLEQRLNESGAEMQELVQRFSDLADQMQLLERRLDGLATAASSEAVPAEATQSPPEPVQESDPRIDALSDQVRQLEQALSEQGERHQALEARFADLLANMDKLAAETAAKVIREELTALMASMA